MEIFLEAKNEAGLTRLQIKEALTASLSGGQYRHVLIVPPDFTRYHSNAGYITNTYYHLFRELGCEADVMPALGTHDPTRGQFEKMYGNIPYEKMIPHDWKHDVVTIGEVPGNYIKEISEGLWEEPVKVEVNRLLLDPAYDLILSVGQVVPHEVVGMANYSKNIFVGAGGSSMIHSSHMVGAVYGMERIMGRIDTPVRKIFDYALERYMGKCPLMFVLTVTTAPEGEIHTHGLFIGDGRNTFERAAALAERKNINYTGKRIKKCVVYLEPTEFHSTWLGNKAIYRTRMAMADAGELLILAPGVREFGEDRTIDRLIRRYGYCGRKRVMELCRREEELGENMGVAAHLIHGSAEGRFQITYAVKEISKEEMEQAGFGAVGYEEAASRYNPEILSDGWNVLPDGEEIFFISNPALGLWMEKEPHL